MDTPQDHMPRKIRTFLRLEPLRRRLAWFTLFCLLAAAFGSYALHRFGSLPAGAVPQSTQILDAEGNVLATLAGGVNRQPVKLSEISPWLVKATLAVEDRRFYEHSGFDARGLVRAAWVDVRHLSKREGASTLTQQLARNLYLDHHRSWSRKLKEAWYAARLEQTYSKEEILQMYLNQIYYGHGAYGAEAAARMYFGKPAKSLTLAESALLAAIPKGPRYYSPHLHPADAEARRQTVLQAMLETKAITREQADAAGRAKPAVQPLPEEPDRIAPYFADYVKRVAVERLGIDERLLNEGGLVITTTLDSGMQRAAEETIKRRLPADSKLQTALIAIDPRNGYIKAMVGGRSYKRNQYNRVFATTRQPGSSFKPIVYAAALEQRVVTPSTRFRSEPTIFYYDNDREIYRPRNFNDRYFHADISLRQAIAASDNIYAVNTIMQVGPEAVMDTARRLGITSRLKAVPSLALGTFPVSPFEMATAYSAFAGGGSRGSPLAILRVEDRFGHVLYEAHPRATQVMSPAVAYVTTRLLESVFDTGGTAHRIAGMLKRPVAGKTGTTNSDAWFVGYSPDLTASVWVGYDRGRAITSSEAHLAAPIFADFMETALKDRPPSDFPMPEGVVSVYVDPSNGLIASPGCPKPVLETFLAGTEPTAKCLIHGPATVEETESGHRGGGWWKKVRSWWHW
ncbi:PBP1A family penicillin-binding protein [Cohnella sp. CFH 77786]|uniref:transglycosylase domain-containing protein n=1 Tax=Cohnella sp. CFH 77786 TaxID=2662265 RepID=UPI001C60D0DE|nr:transglycosylase domain-containing protein [Cohnella sp. CFH 77786]MBW5448687.1 PBP1A family penicillin-binding protein [Cohnella sp. CFH 77786]